MPLTEEANELIALFPIWEEEVWIALQKKNFPGAEENFKLLLSDFSSEEWGKIDWKSVFSGRKMLRGDLSEEEWRVSVQPLIVRSVLNVASGKVLSEIYRDLGPELWPTFHTLLENAVPAPSHEEKMRWLQANKPSVYVFFLATPARVLGAGFGVSRPGGFEKYRRLPEMDQEVFFNYRDAESLYQFGKDNYLTDLKIEELGNIAGEMLLGALEDNKLREAVQGRLHVDTKVAEVIAQKLQNFTRGKIYTASPVYEPTEPIQTETKIEQFLRPEQTTPSATATLEPRTNKPFMLHEERLLAEEAKKESFRGLSLPFGLFGTNGREKAPTPRASVEIPQRKAEEKKVVHYSEYRTNLAPGSSGEFINLETFGKTSVPPQTPAPPIIPSTPETPVTPAAPPAPTPSAPAQPAAKVSLILRADAPRPQREVPLAVKKAETGFSTHNMPPRTDPGAPKTEGNTLDLR